MREICFYYNITSSKNNHERFVFRPGLHPLGDGDADDAQQFFYFVFKQQDQGQPQVFDGRVLFGEHREQVVVMIEFLAQAVGVGGQGRKLMVGQGVFDLAFKERQVEYDFPVQFFFRRPETLQAVRFFLCRRVG